nr:hypothetical protein [Blautia coccoides]
MAERETEGALEASSANLPAISNSRSTAARIRCDFGCSASEPQSKNSTSDGAI